MLEECRSNKTKIEQDFSSVRYAHEVAVNTLSEKIRDSNRSFNLAIMEYGETYLKGRDKLMFRSLKLRDSGAGVEWIKSRFALSRCENYPSTLKRAKNTYGYGALRSNLDPLIRKRDLLHIKLRDLYSVFLAKTPKGSQEHFGIEIECFAPSDGNVRGRFQDFCTANKIKGAHIKSDGSITPESGCEGFEVTLLVIKDSLRDLELVCSWLKQIGARVNKSCGLHVHLDFRHRDNLQQSANRLANALPYLAKLVPKSRRHNSYCELNKNGLDSGTRYSAINLQAYKRFKTLEVRLHSGTVSFEKIASWLVILTNIINNRNFTSAQVDSSVDRFIELLAFPQDEINYYIVNRHKKFNSPESLDEERGEE